MADLRIADVDVRALVATRRYHPSPAAWEDEVLYFLMLDRFSDGQESGYRGNDGNVVSTGSTPPFAAGDAENAPRDAWGQAGQRFCGGTLRGLATKVGYLQRLGVSAVWISPVFKQVASLDTYHGYGIQDFLEIDPRFGTRDDLRALVETAHAHGIRVILDIILNHTGDVFAYAADRYETRRDDGSIVMDPRWDGHEYRVRGFRDADGHPTIPLDTVDLSTHPLAHPDGAVWPAELQRASAFSRKGRISSWDYDPEFLEGDFESLKNVHLGHGGVDEFEPSEALTALAAVYKFWIAFADIDGYRVDTVKHMDLGASRYFGSVIHEFAQSIGKENFYLIAEITGGRTRAFRTLETTGLDAALGVDDIPDKMEYLVKGFRNPEDYFSLFRNSLLVQKESHVWFRNKIVTMFDDHDQVRKGTDKARFCADAGANRQVLGALALNATTLGIPCVYYGTEQAFDGHGRSDQFLRETMFGGAYGAFRSRHRHFFLEEEALYQQIASLLRLRRASLPLRRGRQYLREISGNGVHFGLPRLVSGVMRSVVAWSRIFDDREVLVAINTDPAGPRHAWVTIDNGLHRAGDTLQCVYTADTDAAAHYVSVDSRNGKAVHLTVPPAGVLVYE